MEYTQQDVENNIGLVFMVANEMYGRLCEGKGGMYEYQDLISEGIVGLHFALERFDPSKGFKFSSFAMPTIKGFMLRGHRNLFKELWKAKGAGISAWTISLYKKDTLRPILGVDDRGMGAQKMFDRLDRRMFWKKVLKALTKRQKEVVQLILDGMTLVQISRVLGVSRQAVFITYNNAVKRARSTI